MQCNFGGIIPYKLDGRQTEDINVTALTEDKLNDTVVNQETQKVVAFFAFQSDMSESTVYAETKLLQL
jgi:hypothetical protein